MILPCFGRCHGGARLLRCLAELVQ